MDLVPTSGAGPAATVGALYYPVALVSSIVTVLGLVGGAPGESMLRC